MSERLEIMRQRQREREALTTGPAVHRDLKFHVERSVMGPIDLPYGDEICTRCGVRSSAGCKHWSAM